MKKILYLQSRLRSGGPSTQLLYLVSRLDRSGYDPIVLTLSPEEDETALPDFLSEDIPVYSLSLGRIEGIVKGGRLLREFVDKHKPRLVHSQGWRPDLLSAYYLDHIPRIATLRNHPFEDYVLKFGRMRGRFMAWTHLKSLKRIDEPVGCSRSVSNYVASYGVQADFIQNGVDRGLFHPVDKRAKKKLRHRLNLPENQPLFVSVGHLRRRKAPRTVIKGFLKSELSDVSTLVMIGEGPLKGVCEELVRGRSNVKFTGRIDNVDEYLKASDVFVSASRSEGLPNTVMEALAVGLPVILSDIQPHNEALEYNSNAGFFFPVDDFIALSRILENLRNFSIEELGKASLSIADDHLNADRMSNEYQKKYESLIGKQE